jgi:hypothetical protein
MLSKQNYFEVNSVTFTNQGLNKKEKEQKYNDYVKKYRIRQGVKRANKPLPPVPVKNPRQNKPAQTKFKFSECLLSYAQAAINPFAQIAKLPCIPDNVCAPSFKYRTVIDTTMAVGTRGTGYAMLNPWMMAFNNPGTPASGSDAPCITTAATYDRDDYYVDNDYITDNQVQTHNANSPYDLATLTPGSLRLVAAGIEIQYTGQLLNQSGVVTTLQNDGMKTFQSIGTDISQVKYNQRASVCPVSRESSCYCRYEPTSSDFNDYAPIYDYQPTQLPGTGNYIYPLGTFVTGATPGTTFRVRCVAFFELQLSNAPSTPSDSDPIGYPALQAARTTVLATQQPASDLVSILKRTAYNIGHTISGFGPVIGTALGGALGNPAMGAALGSYSKDIFESLFG